MHPISATAQWVRRKPKEVYNTKWNTIIALLWELFSCTGFKNFLFFVFCYLIRFILNRSQILFRKLTIILNHIRVDKIIANSLGLSQYLNTFYMWDGRFSLNTWQPIQVLIVVYGKRENNGQVKGCILVLTDNELFIVLVVGDHGLLTSLQDRVKSEKLKSLEFEKSAAYDNIRWEMRFYHRLVDARKYSQNLIVNNADKYVVQ